MRIATRTSVKPSLPEQRWFLSRHALERMYQMALERGHVIAVLNEPEISWPSYLGRRVAVSGDVAVVFDPASRAVVTVLWHVDEDWNREPPPFSTPAQAA